MIDKQKLLNIDRRTWNGHTHTEFCPHGSGEKLEDFIEAAINAGIKTYSITEHFPMPTEFYEQASGSRHAIYTASMVQRDLDYYFEKIGLLKTKYQDQITLLLGFEFDYIERYRDWTEEMFKRYASYIDDAVLSVHFLPTETGLRAVDDSYLDFCDGVLKQYQTPLGVAQAYLTTILNAIKWQAQDKPVRYGHITLYKKWRNLFPQNTVWENEITTKIVDNILNELKQREEMLDCNMSGILRSTQMEPSPTLKIIELAQKKHIPLVYGSDCHEVALTTQSYQMYLNEEMYM